VAKNLEARLEQHNLGRGAKYTRSRRPVKLVYREPADDRSTAQQREHAIKRMPVSAKMDLIQAAPKEQQGDRTGNHEE
jgi:putative endonuclease